MFYDDMKVNRPKEIFLEGTVKYERPKAVDAFGPFVTVVTDVYGEDMTQQHFVNECDMSFIMRNFRKTGLLTHVNPVQPHYGDFSNVVDYQSALNLVNEVEEYFSGLPATFRKRFNDDPSEFISYLNDPANAKELVDLGILTAPSEPLKKTLQESSSEVIHGSPSAPKHAGEADGGEL